MRSRYHIAHAGFVSAGGNSFQPAGGLVINLIAVYVNQFAIFLRQFKADVKRFNRIFTGKFKMRNGTGSIGTHFQCFFKQVFAVGVT